MPLTITRDGDWQQIVGTRRVATITVQFDSSYALGGESLTAGDFGLRVIESVKVEPYNGYTFEYVTSNSTLKVYRSNSVSIPTASALQVGNVGATNTDLINFTLPANALRDIGQGLRMSMWGIAANNSTYKSVAVALGTPTISSANLTINTTAHAWRLDTDVIRLDGTRFSYMSRMSQSGNSSTNNMVTCSSASLTFSSTAALRLAAIGGANDDIQCRGWVLEQIASPVSGNNVIEVLNTADLSGLTQVRIQAWGY